MASQAARSWAPPAAALVPAAAASWLVRADVPTAAAAFLALGYLLALAGAAWQTRRGLLPPSAAVGGFAAGLVLAVPAARALAPWLGTASVVAAGLLALGTAGGCAGLASRLAPEPTPPDLPPPEP